jgi:hypothetical protein
VTRQLEAGKSAVMETAFIPGYDNERFRDLRAAYPFEPVQVLCVADEAVLYSRFIERTASGERHPGHVDTTMSREAFSELLRARGYGRLQIGGTVLEVNTTDFAAVDLDALVNVVRALMADPPSGRRCRSGSPPSAQPDCTSTLLHQELKTDN